MRSRPAAHTEPALSRTEPAALVPRKPGYFSGLRCLGQLDRPNLVCEGQGELVLIDRRAAGERVAFERLRAAHRAGTLARQSLLFPVPIELDAALGAQVPALLAPGALLQALGFEAEPFGERTVLLRAVPELLAKADPKPLVLDVLARALGDGADEGGGPTGAQRRLERVLSTLACHAVARAGEVLSPEDLRGLLEGLDDVELGAHGLHGRPVVVRISVAELARRFGCA